MNKQNPDRSLQRPVLFLPHQVAVSSQGVPRVTVTGLAASVLTVVPVVGGTPVAGTSLHVLPAAAGASLPVTVAVGVAAGRLGGAGGNTGTT